MVVLLLLVAGGGRSVWSSPFPAGACPGGRRRGCAWIRRSAGGAAERTLTRHPLRALLLRRRESEWRRPLPSLRPTHLLLGREVRRRRHGQLGHLVVSVARAAPPLPGPDGEEKGGTQERSWLGVQKGGTKEEERRSALRSHVYGGAREMRGRERRGRRER